MSHEKSATATLMSGGKKRYANVDTTGDDKGRVLGARTFSTMADAVIEAQSRSEFGRQEKGKQPRSQAQRKNPRDKNRPTNPVTKLLGGG